MARAIAMMSGRMRSATPSVALSIESAEDAVLALPLRFVGELLPLRVVGKSVRTRRERRGSVTGRHPPADVLIDGRRFCEPSATSMRLSSGWVTSDRPTIPASVSRLGATLSGTGDTVASLRIHMVSRRSTSWQDLIFARTRQASLVRSWGVISLSGLPMISSL